MPEGRRPRVSSRASARLLAAVLALGLIQGCWFSSSGHEAAEESATRPWFKVSCRLPIDYLERIRRGHFAGRSPDVLVVPEKPNFAGSFAFTTHAGPWPYVQRVPLVFYGPGFIKPQGELRLDRDVDLTDLAPTLSELLDTSLPPGSGSPILETLEPTAKRASDLKLIVTVVWDGGGWNVLNRWPNEWPHLKELIRGGTSVGNVTVGSSPSTTPAVHTTIGTGAWPQRHGAVDIPLRRNGEMVPSFEGMSAEDVILPTLADLYDLQTDNEAKVAMVGEKAWHLGMLGHGASFPGADKDIAVMWNLEHRLVTNRDDYRLPRYLTKRPALERERETLDAEDGRLDSAWLGHDVLDVRNEWRHSPLWTLYQPKLLRSLLSHERFGDNGVTGLLYINFKHMDVVGHYPRDVKELRSTMGYTDDALGELTGYLDRYVGEGKWVLAVTADHGQTPDPRLTGAWPIDLNALLDDLAVHFDVEPNEVFQDGRPTGLWLDRATMRAQGIALADVSEFLVNYRLEDNISSDRDVPSEYRGRRNERLFAAAFPSEQLDEVWECARRR